MKSKYEIEMDFSETISQAEELEEISKGLSRMACNSMPGVLDILAAAWKGENAVGYISKGCNLATDILNVAEKLMKMADEMRYTANIVYKAEIAAISCISDY